MALRRGEQAKNIIKETLINNLQDCFVAEQDKKLYFNIKENDEIVQIAISMTVPKNTIGNQDNMNNETSYVGINQSADVEISQEDKKKIADLMEKLGLN